MTIRDATKNDVEAVLNLLGELKVSGYTEMGMDASGVKRGEDAAEFLTRALEDEYVMVKVAEDDEVQGVVVAYLLPKIFDGEYRMLIEELVVGAEARGGGIGSKLLLAVEIEARDRGVKVVKCTTGTELKANEFYKKNEYVHFENAYRKKLG